MSDVNRENICCYKGQAAGFSRVFEPLFSILPTSLAFGVRHGARLLPRERQRVEKAVAEAAGGQHGERASVLQQFGTYVQRRLL